jgi:hypothetical protein
MMSVMLVLMRMIVVMVAMIVDMVVVMPRVMVMVRLVLLLIAEPGTLQENNAHSCNQNSRRQSQPGVELFWKNIV